MARPAGLEPATVGFEVHYSIQLSYERKIYYFFTTTFSATYIIIDGKL